MDVDPEQFICLSYPEMKNIIKIRITIFFYWQKPSMFSLLLVPVFFLSDCYPVVAGAMNQLNVKNNL